MFISDYNGAHPFVRDYLGSLADLPLPRLGDITRYPLIADDEALRAKVAGLHARYDGVAYAPGQVLSAGGSSALLATFCTWLLLSGCTRVHYLPPLYYNFAYLLKRFGIQPVPVSERHAFEPEIELRLPGDQSVLLLVDPVWYAGRRVPDRVLDALRDWQQATASLIFVDGTFQYMRWDGVPAERSATLGMERTVRLVSPTKHLSLHGFRFAYLLTHEPLRAELAELHMNLHGDTSLSDRLFAHRALDVMLDEGNHALIDHVRDNYRWLVDQGALCAHVDIETGYFLFAAPRLPRTRFLAMSQEFFELHGYPDHVRINLLNDVAIAALVDGEARAHRAVERSVPCH